ncbi:Thioesterase superfamily protein [Helicobacter mustelae]|uniref:PaaI family thioesterase n=1 Tax=Helicobacter mustelae TaxID=217 RepID=UPI000DFFA860|nr:PaaI family thioesterase [Helicobacter mustelae]STP13306.1 Thioesterase superfamily protein [Helicobacter mustelae]
MQEQDFEQTSSLIKPKDKLLICNAINVDLCGELVSIKEGSAQVVFSASSIMTTDGEKSIHAGFIFNSASYAALCAINKRNSIIIGSDVKFLAPIEIGHEILFQATTLQSGIKKCEVKVEGFLLDIKVFEGMFYIAIFDKKLFKLKLKEEGNAR